ncbi:MAG TPA: amidohydrolase family protein [Geminicoccaceae bacterium]|nr:amidohydrolase family protein [Geminicoccus sp.]HMU52990.1 amidohydrolase family protein [Geminicoccaceae bacterium]
MDLLITDALVATCDTERRLLDRGAVAVRGNRIAAVGATADLVRDFPDLPRMPAHGLMVCPGFINAHSHTAMIVLRGTIEDWVGNAVYGYMVPIAYEMSTEELQVLVTLGCLEAIRSGTTSLLELFRFLPSYGEAMASTGMRLWLGEHAADINTLRMRLGDRSVDKAFGQGCLDRNIEMIERFHGFADDRVRCLVAAHATDNCSPWMLGELDAMATRHGLTRTIHLAQSADEVKTDATLYGKTPAEYLDSQGWLRPDLVGAHWSFCTPSDIELLAGRGVQMAHCPANSSTKGPHRTLIGLIRDAGVNIGIGSDDKTYDMFHALKLTAVLHRGGKGRAVENGVEPQPQAVLDGITRNAARSLGAEDEIGSIEPGKKADLTILDTRVAAMRPIINPISNLVHYGHPGMVHSVMVDGRFLMRDRQVLTIDEELILREGQAVTKRVWERMLAKNPDIPPPQALHWYDV